MTEKSESEMDKEKSSEMDDKKPNAEELQAELEKTRKALSDANKEAADRRKRLEKLEAAEIERKQAEMTEAEKVQARLTEMEAALTQAKAEKTAADLRAETMLKRSAVIVAAADFQDPSDVLKLVSLDELTVNDKGEVEGADKLLEALRKSKPYLLKEPRQVRGTPNGSRDRKPTENNQQRARAEKPLVHL
jgi:DNA repair exonuclease SbcCD ATPase subunit